VQAPGPRGAGSARGGFTLLEVLVAVAVFGLLFTVLTGIAMQGLRAEGESDRELRASLLADRALAELETNLDLGVVPPLGREEREEEEFLVEVEVAAFDLELPEDPRGKRELGRQVPSGSLLGRGPGSSASPLRRIDVRVHWGEGVLEREVRRTSFALDAEAAAPLLEGLVASQAAREAGEDEPDDEPEPESPDPDDDPDEAGAGE
jgi:prepilin-type N-terminal cleavage/methylation domain-containing protein